MTFSHRDATYVHHNARCVHGNSFPSDASKVVLHDTIFITNTETRQFSLQARHALNKTKSRRPRAGSAARKLLSSSKSYLELVPPAGVCGIAFFFAVQAMERRQHDHPFFAYLGGLRWRVRGGVERKWTQKQ